ncbi:hypothetical protein CHS0354_002016 [Potamilus streckersoni]|uniref:methionine adenosyltransferase n=1 Tax=Potamilus streckersoni TaxID=2493646 RepID=A0AAE0T6Q8_9BIVA|nr:hypothetical protein CHS0354_002016 [Potamilus streckersoni]
MEQENLCAHVRSISQYLHQQLNGLKKYPILGDVRGSHLMVGLEYVKNNSTMEDFSPEAKPGSRIVEKCFAKGLIIRPLADTINVLSPPLIWKKEQVDEFISILESKSVTEGHPDKMADNISDAVLDEALKQDKHSRVACETLLTTGLVVIAGEIRTNAVLDFQNIARDTIRDLGYDDHMKGFDYKTCAVVVTVGKQSPDIAQGVDEASNKDLGAGDQGMMFGYATDETPDLMPMPIYLAHKLTQGLTQARKSGQIPYLRPDGKSQVTLRYEDNKPVHIDCIVISTQHAEEITQSAIRHDVIEKIVKKHAAGKFN